MGQRSSFQASWMVDSILMVDDDTGEHRWESKVFAAGRLGFPGGSASFRFEPGGIVGLTPPSPPRERIPRSISRIAPLNRPLTPSLSPCEGERGFNVPTIFSGLTLCGACH